MRALQVRAEQRRRAVGVAGLQGCGDLAVLGDEALQPRGVAGHGGRGDPLVAVAQGIVLAGQQAVASRVDDRPVERAVGPREAGAAVLERRLLVGDEAAQRLRERRPGAGGAARGVLLDQHPRLEHVLGLRRGDRDHERAAARVELEQALGLELHEGLADRGAGDVQPVGDLVLAQQRAAGEAAVEQARLDVVVGQLGRRAPAREELVLPGLRWRGHRLVG